MSSISQGDPEDIFKKKVRNRQCPTCGAKRYKPCMTKSGIPKKGPYASSFHMDRVYLAYPNKNSNLDWGK